MEQYMEIPIEHALFQLESFEDIKDEEFSESITEGFHEEIKEEFNKEIKEEFSKPLKQEVSELIMDELSESFTERFQEEIKEDFSEEINDKPLEIDNVWIKGEPNVKDEPELADGLSGAPPDSVDPLALPAELPPAQQSPAVQWVVLPSALPTQPLLLAPLAGLLAPCGATGNQNFQVCIPSLNSAVAVGGGDAAVAVAGVLPSTPSTAAPAELPSPCPAEQLHVLGGLTPLPRLQPLRPRKRPPSTATKQPVPEKRTVAPAQSVSLQPSQAPVAETCRRSQQQEASVPTHCPEPEEQSDATSGQPHRCNLCSASFSTFVDLRRHLLCHTLAGSRPPCDRCGAKMPNYTQLVYHRLTRCRRNGDPPAPLPVCRRKAYRCNLCCCSFSHPSLLLAHKRLKHKEQAATSEDPDSSLASERTSEQSSQPAVGSQQSPLYALTPKHSSTSALPSKEFSKSALASKQSSKSALASKQSSRSALASKQSSKSALASRQSSTSALVSKQSSKSALASKQSSKSALASKQSSKSALASKQSSKSALASKQSSKSALASKQSSKSALASRQSSTSALVSKQSSKSALASKQSSKSALASKQSSTSALAPKQSSRSALATEQSSTSALAPKQSSTSALVSKQSSKSALASKQSSKSALASKQSSKSALASKQSSKSALASRQSSTSALVSKQSSKSALASKQSSKSALASKQSSTSALAPKQSSRSALATEQSSTSALASKQSSNSALASKQSSESALASKQSSKSALTSKQSSTSALVSKQSSESALASKQSSKSALASKQSSTSAVAPKQSLSSATQSLCSWCSAMMPNYTKLHDHQLTCPRRPKKPRPPQAQHTCNWCGGKFFHIKLLKAHYRSKHWTQMQAQRAAALKDPEAFSASARPSEQTSDLAMGSEQSSPSALASKKYSSAVSVETSVTTSFSPTVSASTMSPTSPTPDSVTVSAASEAPSRVTRSSEKTRAAAKARTKLPPASTAAPTNPELAMTPCRVSILRLDALTSTVAAPVPASTKKQTPTSQTLKSTAFSAPIAAAKARTKLCQAQNAAPTNPELVMTPCRVSILRLDALTSTMAAPVSESTKKQTPTSQTLKSTAFSTIVGSGKKITSAAARAMTTAVVKAASASGSKTRKDRAKTTPVSVLRRSTRKTTVMNLTSPVRASESGMPVTPATGGTTAGTVKAKPTTVSLPTPSTVTASTPACVATTASGEPTDSPGTAAAAVTTALQIVTASDSQLSARPTPTVDLPPIILSSVAPIVSVLAPALAPTSAIPLAEGPSPTTMLTLPTPGSPLCALAPHETPLILQEAATCGRLFRAIGFSPGNPEHMLSPPWWNKELLLQKLSARRYPHLQPIAPKPTNLTVVPGIVLNICSNLDQNPKPSPEAVPNPAPIPVVYSTSKYMPIPATSLQKQPDKLTLQQRKQLPEPATNPEPSCHKQRLDKLTPQKRKQLPKPATNPEPSCRKQRLDKLTPQKHKKLPESASNPEPSRCRQRLDKLTPEQRNQLSTAICQTIAEAAR